MEHADTKPKNKKCMDAFKHRIGLGVYKIEKMLYMNASKSVLH